MILGNLFDHISNTSNIILSVNLPDIGNLVTCVVCTTMEYSTEQRVFIVEQFHRLNSYVIQVQIHSFKANNLSTRSKIPPNWTGYKSAQGKLWTKAFEMHA